MDCLWKNNWEATKERYKAWWEGNGLLVAVWGNGLHTGLPNDPSIPLPDRTSTPQLRNEDPAAFAEHERRLLNLKRFPLDIVPFAYTDYGTVPLAELLGTLAEPREETVWYRHTDLSPEQDRKLLFDTAAPSWKRMRGIAETNRKLAGDRYFSGAPALCPGLDVLAELRGPQNLMMDLLTEPDWVHSKLAEIQEASYQAMDAMNPVLRYQDSSFFHAFFMLWAPTDCALAQCDAAALISPDMFAEFNIPYLRDFCRRVDRVLYHVDGPDALRTVDQLLEVEELDAIEFTPGPQIPGGGDPCWYPMYRKIKEAGKSVQAVWMKSRDVEPLLDAVGSAGMYLEVEIDTMAEAEELDRIVARYR
ncbi:hypothetical protein MASR2M78_34670 [Treponema sp.]